MITNLTNESSHRNKFLEVIVGATQYNDDEDSRTEEELYRKVDFWKRKWQHSLNLEQNFIYYNKCLLIQSGEKPRMDHYVSEELSDILNESAEQYNLYLSALKDRQKTKEIRPLDSEEVENICEYCDNKIPFNECCDVCGVKEPEQDADLDTFEREQYRDTNPMLEDVTNQEGENIATTYISLTLMDKMKVTEDPMKLKNDNTVRQEEYLPRSSVKTNYEDDVHGVSMPLSDGVGDMVGAVYLKETYSEDSGFVLVNMDDGSAQRSSKDNGESNGRDQIPLGDKWACAKCSSLNSFTHLVCQACRLEAPHENKWACSRCTFINEPSSSICKTCDKIKDGPRVPQVSADSTDEYCWRAVCRRLLQGGKYCSQCGVDQNGDRSPGGLLYKRIDARMTHVWQCTRCSHLSDVLYNKCEMCNNDRLKQGNKACPKCGWVSSIGNRVCIKCDK